MPATILRFPSGGLIDRRVKIVSRDYAFGELAQSGHVSGTGPASTALPSIPNLPDGPHTSGCGIQGQALFDAPSTQRVVVFCRGHNRDSKPIAYRLTIACTVSHGFNVSAEILQFGRMNDAPNRVRELRMARGLSQANLGDAIGVHKMTISDIERGQIELTLSYMRKLARALEVEIDELFSRSDHPGQMNDEERELLSAFRHSEDAAKAFLLTSARAIAQRDEAA